MPGPPSQPTSPPGTDRPVVFARSDAARIEQVVRYVEKTHRLPPTPRRARRGGSDTANILIRITQDVGPRSGATAGTGTGYFQLVNAAGTMTDDTAFGEVPFSSFYDKTIKAGVSAYAFGGFANELWWVVAPGSCTMVSGGTAAAQPAPATAPSPAVPPADAAAPAMMAALAAAPTPTVVPLPFKYVAILPP
jgi:hypothetical protein